MEIENLCMGCMSDKGHSQECSRCGWVEGSPPSSLLHLHPRTLLNDKYLIGCVLGQGGFGITYLAWDINLNLKLAIKEYFPSELVSRAAGHSMVSVHTENMDSQYQYGLEKFLLEARTLAQFEGHPNIVSVRDFFKANDTAYLVMGYVEGATLKEYLASHNGLIPYGRALDIIMPVLDALNEIHTVDILHRDISPDNIFINERGQVVLIDFGAARQAIGEQGRSVSIILKPGYTPEEQYRSKGIQGPWTDIYAVAATMYRAITGQLPPEALDRLDQDTIIPPSGQGIEISHNAEQTLLKAMAVRAKDRFQSVKEFQEALLGNGKITGEDEDDVAELDKSTTYSPISKAHPSSSALPYTSVTQPHNNELESASRPNLSELYSIKPEASPPQEGRLPHDKPVGSVSHELQPGPKTGHNPYASSRRETQSRSQQLSRPRQVPSHLSSSSPVYNQYDNYPYSGPDKSSVSQKKGGPTGSVVLVVFLLMALMGVFAAVFTFAGIIPSDWLPFNLAAVNDRQENRLTDDVENENKTDHLNQDHDQEPMEDDTLEGDLSEEILYDDITDIINDGTPGDLNEGDGSNEVREPPSRSLPTSLWELDPKLVEFTVFSHGGYKLIINYRTPESPVNVNLEMVYYREDDGKIAYRQEDTGVLDTNTSRLALDSDFTGYDLYQLGFSSGQHRVVAYIDDKEMAREKFYVN